METDVRAAADRIREQIKSEEELISALERSLTEEPAREWLKQAKNYVNDARAILQGVEQSPTPLVLIRGSSEFLGLAADHRKKVQDARDKYGPGVMLAG